MREIGFPLVPAFGDPFGWGRYDRRFVDFRMWPFL